MFVRALDPTNRFGEQIFLTDNNGVGMGGPTGQAGACNATGTNTFSGNTYEDVLGETSVHWWHHYALIWDSRGLPGVDNGKATVALYMDRRLVSRFWNADCSPITFPAPPPGSLIKLLDFDRVDVGSARIDNLRIWDCATIYFHPNREAPVGRTCIR